MNDRLKAILRYQEEDLKLREFEQKLESNPHYREAIKARQAATAASARMEACEKRAGEILAAIERAQARFEETLKELSELREGVEESTIDDDVEYSVSKLRKLEASLSALDREIGELRKQTVDTLKTYSDSRNTYKAEKDRYDAEKKVYGEAAAVDKPQMDEIRQKLEELARGVDPVLLEKYKRGRHDHRGATFVEVMREGDTYRCPSCRMALPLNTVVMLKSEGIIECESCHHQIYIQD